MVHQMIIVLVLSAFTAVLSQPVSSTLSSGVVDHIAVSDTNVYISSGSNVYRLSANLQMTGSPVSVGGNVLGMATTGDGGWLVVCTDATNSPCSTLNGSTLTSTPIGNGGSDGSGSDLTVFTAPVSGGESIYTGSYGSDRIRYRQYGFDGSSLMRTVDQGTSGFRGRQFISGFFTLGYANYVVLDGTASTGFYELRIIRVCNSTADGTSPYFNNQYELILGCNYFTNGRYFSPSYISTSVINGVTLLIGIHFESGSGDTPSVCSFSLLDINSAMDGAFDTCVMGNTGSSNILWQSQSCSGLSGTICDISGTVPAVGVVNPLVSSNIISNTTILNGLTATLGLTIDNIDLVYLAFTVGNNHYVEKYVLNNGSLSFLSEVELMSPLRNLTGSDNSDYIYGINGTIGLTTSTTGNAIFGIRTDKCSSSVTSCGECVSLGDPLCGWCVVERKCSRRSHCQGSTSSERFIMNGATSSCITNVSIAPPRFVFDLQPMPYQVNISISTSSSQISHFPKLSGEEYFCVFNGVMVPLLVGDDGGLLCQVQPVISQLTDMQLATNFSIFSNLTGVNFLSLHPNPSPYTFYNCSSASRCSNCVDTNGVCGWCQLDFKCTGTNSTCSGSNNWLSIKNVETPRDLCPFLQPSTNPDGNYTQPANVMKNLILYTSNTVDVTGLNYECVYGTITRPATRANDTAVICDVSQVITLTGGNTMTQTLPFTLRQTSMGKVYPLEINTTTNTLNVILYDCPGLATGCSSCLATTIDTGFGCSWCTVSNQCRERTFCGDPSDVTVMESSNCPLPMITDFTPKNGSSKGGTRVVITGTNLGTQLSDIISITIGSSRSCSSISTYVPGQRIICTITDDTNGIDISDSIRVTIRNSQSQDITATSNEAFELLTPVIGSIIPTLGPVSGGTKVIVMGTNLNIGNQEETRVIMRETVNKRASSGCPDVNCTIMSIDSTEIRCTSNPTVNTTCSRTVSVSINGNDADLANNAMVTYSYRNDPTFGGVSPQQTIPAGGINLTFMGTNVDIIQSPMIAINDSRFPTSSIESCVSTSDTTLICTAPIINSPISDSDYGQLVSYKLILDGAPSPDSNMFQLRLTLRRDPNITGVSETITADDSGAYEITIQGSNFMSVDQSEIMITLTDINNPSETHTCDIQTLSDTIINCMAPIKPIGTTLSLQVIIGNLVFPLDGSSAFTVTYVQLQPASDVGLIIGIIVSLFIIVIAIIIVIVLVVNVIVFKYCQTSKTEISAKMIEGNQVVLMSDNVVYSGNTNVPFSQSNPAYVAASNVHMYEELPYSAGAKSSDEVPPNLPERLPTVGSNTEPIESTNVKPEDHTAEPDDDYVEPFETNVEPDDDYVEPFESNAEPDDDYIEPFESI